MASQKIDIPRLCMAMQRSRYVLQRFRMERMEAVREYVGHHWSEESAPKEQPVNLLAMYVNIMASTLVPQNPRVLLSTFEASMKPMVSAMQEWVNKELVATNIGDTIQRVVTDALFSVGICKVGIATPIDSAEVGWNLPAGSPFAERVDLDDFVFDVHARAFGEETFIGHRFRVPTAVANKFYGKGNDFVGEYDELYNAEGDERISVLGRTTYSGYDEEFEDHVTLWEVYLPRHKLVVTLGNNQVIGADTLGEFFKYGGSRLSKAIKTARYIGPDSGPYKILGFGLVPGNAMPKGPVQDLLELNRAVNMCYRKLIRQAARMKMVGCASDDQDAKSLQDASDGDVVRAKPDAVAEQMFGGANQQLLQFAMALKEMFSWLAGNLDILAGLSPQSKTAAQDEMLNTNSNRMMTDKQNRTVNFIEQVIRGVAWYWYHDPQHVMRSTYQLTGMPEMNIQRYITPQDRQKGKFENLDILVDPYSMQHTTPDSRAAFMQQIVSQVWAPMQQAFMTQGITLDMQKFLDKVGTYKNQPDLKEILTISSPADMMGGGGEQQGGAGGQQGGGAPTERNYTRRSLGADSPAAQKSGMQNILSAAASSPPPKQSRPSMNGAPR